MEYMYSAAGARAVCRDEKKAMNERGPLNREDSEYLQTGYLPDHRNSSQPLRVFLVIVTFSESFGKTITRSTLKIRVVAGKAQKQGSGMGWLGEANSICSNCMMHVYGVYKICSRVGGGI